MPPCKDFQDCARCARPACDHAEAIQPSIPGVCIGYVGLPDCAACGGTSWAHGAEEPHAIPDVCAGYDGPRQFEGQGGGFGGGGASGGW